MVNQSLMKEAIYNGKKTVSSTSSVGIVGQPTCKSVKLEHTFMVCFLGGQTVKHLPVM